MSRDFVLVLGGGVVSLITTLVVLFIADFFHRRDTERTQLSSASDKFSTGQLGSDEQS